MKKTILITLSVFFIFYSCEETEPIDPIDSTPPTVTITSPQNNSTVSEIVIITSMSSDNVGVKKVELWIGGISTGIEDDSEPYSMEWNTTTFEDGEYTIIVRSHDESDNTTDSEPFTLIVDNSSSSPNPVDIVSIIYSDMEMEITWRKCLDGDFQKYLIKRGDNTGLDYETVFEGFNVDDTSTTITNFDPLIERYYYVEVHDIFDLYSVSEGYVVLHNSPDLVNFIEVSQEQDSFLLTWSGFSGNHFREYRILESSEEDMTNPTILSISNEIDLTTFRVRNLPENYRRYYQIQVLDLFDLSSVSNIIGGSNYPKIVFSSTGEGNLDIYVMDEDGEMRKRLTTHTEQDDYPVFTSNNENIVFESRRTGQGSRIMTMDKYGEDKIILSDYDSDSYHSVTSEGNYVVFMSPDDGFNQIYRMNLDGENLTNLINGDRQEGQFSLSRDGSLITYISYERFNPDNLCEIYTVSINGDNVQSQTNSEFTKNTPVFTPNGNQIVYVGYTTNRDIYIMNLDGTENMNLTNTEYNETYPIVTNDGQYIIYLSDENDNQDLYRIDVSGENKLQLTSSGYTDDTPTLTSYDNKILYISEKDGVREIYIMEVDGTGETRLTFNEGYSYHPSFSNH
jgi:Tol biopolymer transport system component